MTTRRLSPPHPESGNVIFFILLAIALIGLVTAALRMGGLDGANIDAEQLTVQASQVRQYGSELERGVTFAMNNGISETEIRFAHPDAPAAYGNDYTVNAEAQIFSPQGGGAAYKPAPSGVQSTVSNWEFYGTTALPGVGGDRPELIAVLPNVTPEFCDRINRMNGYAAGATLTDDGTCLYTGATNRFGNATQFTDGAPNTPLAAGFIEPAMEACVVCTGPNPDEYHFYHVLKAR